MGAGRVAGTACMVNETRRPPRWTSYGQVCEISASCPAGASHVPEPSRLYQRAGQPAWSGRRHIHCPLGAGQEPQTQRNRSAAVRRHAFLPVPGRTGRQCGLAAGTHPQRRATRHFTVRHQAEGIAQRLFPNWNIAYSDNIGADISTLFEPARSKSSSLDTLRGLVSSLSLQTA